MRGGEIDIRLKVGGGCWGRVRVRRRRRFCGRRMRSESEGFDSRGIIVLALGIIEIFCGFWIVGCLGGGVLGF